jgi:DNA-binding transcriptional MerR regulator
MDKKNSELIKITDLTTQLGLSSRSLRYYEQIGLIQSVRPEFEKYRFYESETIERLKQIIVLRKMQIPVKDILRIYESESMSVVVETFVNRIHAIDDEIGALAELKHIVGDFLQTMIDNGVTKISAIPLLYEEMDKQLELMEERKPVTYEDLSNISERLGKPIESSILSLPSMRVISSYLKENAKESDTEGFSCYIQQNGFLPGNHERFEFQNESGEVIILRVPDDFTNDSVYFGFNFDGGLFAAANVYLDEDLGERFRSLISSFDDNKYYQVDYQNDGSLRHPALLENLISPDEKRELVALLVPVKKRMADPALFDPPKEITDITIAEIEAANPVLWEVDVPLDKLTPINSPHYRVMENGEVEYTGWISTRVLNTNVAVKLPFRVDLEFKIGEGARYGFGATEGSIILYHGNELSYRFGINMNNWTISPGEALQFHQPIFHDFYNFPGRGTVEIGEYSRLTWIIGAKHLAVFIGGELRYCGVNFPYMTLDLNREEAQSIIIGSNGQGMKYFRKIWVSQLAYTPKNKIEKEGLVMITKQSNNIIPTIHRLVTSEHGENYWFNACAKYVMEALNEPDYNYWFFAGLTGDVFTQHYPKSGNYSGDARSSYYIDKVDISFAEDIFEKCGYASSFISGNILRKNKEMYLQTLLSYIDKGIPVIVWQNSNEAGANIVGVFVGYEENGQTLLYISGDNNEPQRISLEKALSFEGDGKNSGWIFVGEKKDQKDLKQIYRDAFASLPEILTTQTDGHYFGAEAFRAWAANIENGYFDGMKPEEFDGWGMYNNFICVLATNGSCCYGFLDKARELNPDMTFLEEISRLYKRIGAMWNNDNGTDLEALGGGFNVTLGVLQDKEKRGKIVQKIREFAKVTDEIVRILTEGMAKEKLVCNSFKYIKLGKVRFIGINASRTNEGWDDLWARSGEFMPDLEALAVDYGTDIAEPCSMMHHNGNEVDSENHFLAGRFFKADTPVPEGYDYYDVPTENAAYAVYTTAEYDGALGSAYYATRDKILADGVGIPYPHAYWHAEVYTAGRPHEGNYRFGYMFSVDEKAGNLTTK